jgi:hypothetical protein
MIYHSSKSRWYFLIAQPWSVQNIPWPQIMWLLHYLHFFQLAHRLWPYFAWALRASCKKGRPEGLKDLQTPGPRGWDQPIDFQPCMAHLQWWAPACSAKHVGKRSYFKFNDIQSTKIFKVQGNIFEMFLVTTPVRWQDVEHRAHRRSCSAVGQNK